MFVWVRVSICDGAVVVILEYLSAGLCWVLMKDMLIFVLFCWMILDSFLRSLFLFQFLDPHDILMMEKMDGAESEMMLIVESVW